MELLVNPVHRLGEKNVFCPHYRGCLDYAVKSSWESWNCNGCDYKSIKEPLNNLRFPVDDGTPFYSMGKP
jgi:hypothetical protein